MEWRSWQYKNLTLLVLAFVFAVVLGSFEPFQEVLFNTGFIAAFAAGAIFVSTFTAPLAAAILLILAEKYSLIGIGLTAAAGAIISDFLFFRLIKDNLASEIAPIYEKLEGNHFKKILHTKHFRWMFPVIGAIIILSPLPNDTGLHLLGIPKLRPHQFIFLSLALNTIGIIFILLLSFIIKP
jgi:hypothetical protein